MKNITDKLKNFKIKNFFNGLTKLIENHTLTMLIMVAGIMVGFSLFSVSSLTDTASESSSQTNGDIPTPLSTLNIKEETEKALLALKQDQGVSIVSNIATYRRSAFSSATSESSWVVEAAEVLEKFKQENEYYPTDSDIAIVLRSAVIVPEDSDGKTVNTDGSDYSYVAEGCDNGRCSGFFLTAKIKNSIYQLGETDFTRRSWVNSTSEALDAYNKSSSKKLYPTEKDFVKVLTTFYKETLSSEFVADDPQGIEVNEDTSAYNYKGINCTADGCESFVLRTTFKDGALYFQQSK